MNPAKRAIIELHKDDDDLDNWTGQGYVHEQALLYFNPNLEINNSYGESASISIKKTMVYITIKRLMQIEIKFCHSKICTKRYFRNNFTKGFQKRRKRFSFLIYVILIQGQYFLLTKQTIIEYSQILKISAFG